MVQGTKYFPHVFRSSETQGDHFRRYPNLKTIPPTLATRGFVVYGTSAIYQTIFITKRTDRSGPFSELENLCPSEILGHFPDWKVIAQPGPFFKLKNDYPEINNISMLPPNLGVNSYFSNKEVISTCTSLSRKYANFS
jgi:hypothetical protein